MRHKLYILALVFLLVSMSAIGCSESASEPEPEAPPPAVEEEKALLPLRAKLMDFNVETTEKMITCQSTFGVSNPNDVEIVLVAVLHKVTPHPPSFALWPQVVEYRNLPVPANGSITTIETYTIPNQGMGAAFWPLLTSPKTKWAVTGKVAFSPSMCGEVGFVETVEEE